MILKHCTVNRCHFRGKAHISNSVATSNLILNCLVFLKRKKLSSLMWQEDEDRNSGRRVPVPLKWGWRGGGGQRARRLELCMTDLSLNLTVYVSPTVPRHRSYSQLLSKQDAWGVNVNWLAPDCLLSHQRFHEPCQNYLLCPRWIFFHTKYSTVRKHISFKIIYIYYKAQPLYPPAVWQLGIWHCPGLDCVILAYTHNASQQKLFLHSFSQYCSQCHLTGY